MPDALTLSPEPIQSAEAPAELTLTSREFVALTGVSAERVRTWQRRFAFPVSTPDRRGRRGFFASDVPRVLAVRQLIDGGEPVAEAVRTVVAGYALQMDVSVLEEAFGALPTPVVAVSGPAPAELFWANAAALEDAPARASTSLPHPLPDRSSALQHLLVDPPESPVWLAHRPWFADSDSLQPADELPTPVRAMAWAYGAPSFVPAVLVVVDVPAVEEEPETVDVVPADATALASSAVREASRVDHAWAVAAGSARRALQRGTGRRAIDDALGALVAARVVRDAIIVLPQGEEIRAVLSARGRPATAPVSPEACDELHRALAQDRLVALSALTAAEFAGGPGCYAGAIPLVAGRVELGYLVLVCDEHLDESETHCALIQGFGTALAAAIARDRAHKKLQRIRGA